MAAACRSWQPISEYRQRLRQAERVTIQPLDPRLDMPGDDITRRNAPCARSASKKKERAAARPSAPPMGPGAQQLIEIKRVPAARLEQRAGTARPRCLHQVRPARASATAAVLSNAGRTAVATALTASRAPSLLTGSACRNASTTAASRPSIRSGEIGQPAKRRCACPVGVIHRDQHRLAGGHVHGQPVQAVHQRKRRVVARRAGQPARTASHAPLRRARPATRHARAGSAEASSRSNS